MIKFSTTQQMTSKMNPGCKNSPYGNQDGIAMVAALLFLVMLALLAIVATNRSTTDANRTEAYKESRDALYIADAGIEHAKLALKTATVDTVLAAGGILNLDGDATVDFNNGTYSVVLTDNEDGTADTDDNDGIVNVTSTGTTEEGTTRAITAVVTLSSATFSPNGAILTEGDLTISGNPDINSNSGNGGVHSNSNLNATGTPTIDGNVTASSDINGGSVTECNSKVDFGTSGGSCSANEAEQTLPVINPLEFKSDADYRLEDDGNVYDSNGGFVSSGGGSGWNGWKWNSGTQEWIISGNSAIDGMFYVEGNVTISGNPGSVEDPWEVSLIAEGDIVISGNPEYKNYKDTNDSEGVQNLFMVAGLDIKMSGNPSQAIQGILAAREQIAISGNPDIQGFIVASDKCDQGVTNCKDINDNSYTHSETVKEGSKVSGNPTITNNGTTVSPFSTSDVTVSVVSWNG